MPSDAGERFARALVGKRFDELRSVLHPKIDFRALLPARVDEASSAETFIAEIAAQWFDDRDSVDELLWVESTSVPGREHVGYRLAVHNPDGRFVVEHHAYYEVTDGLITWMRCLCSGWRPAE